MELFESRRKKIFRGLLLLFPVFLLIFACILFVAGVSHTSGQALVKEQDALEQALKNSAVRSYAMNILKILHSSLMITISPMTKTDLS